MGHKFDEGRDRLRKLVAKAAARKPLLPMVHSTDVYALGDMIDSRSIAPQDCPVFEGETLTYLFYGRPAFRPNMNAEPTSMGHYMPIVLIFRPDWVLKIKRVFPFDSGAFHEGYYSRFLHKKMGLGDFGLEPDPDTPGQVIESFFGDNEAYLGARGLAATDIDPAEFEAQAYTALITDKGANAVDSRGGGIEIQTDETVAFFEAVEAVILPGQYKDSQIGRTLEAAGIELIPYRVTDRARPNEHTGQLHELCLAYYVRRELIAEEKI